MAKILTDAECQKLWDESKKLNIDSPEGKQIMDYLKREQANFPRQRAKNFETLGDVLGSGNRMKL